MDVGLGALKMRKKAIQEWKSDKCGKIYKGGRFIRPLQISKLKIHMDYPISLYGYTYDSRLDLCKECSAEFLDVYSRWRLSECSKKYEGGEE